MANRVSTMERKRSKRRMTWYILFACIIVFFAAIGLMDNLSEAKKDIECAWCGGTGYSHSYYAGENASAEEMLKWVVSKTPCTYCNGTGTKR